MTDVRVITLTGAEAALGDSVIEEFASRLRGELLRPCDPGYEEAHSVWNDLIDKHPALIARCAGVGDVIDSVNFARENDLLVAVRGGGHNVAGNAVCNGGLVIDLSPMKGIRVDPKRRTVRAEGGATWADLDRETLLEDALPDVRAPLGVAPGDLVRPVVEAAYEGWRLPLLRFAQPKDGPRPPPKAATRQVSEFGDGETPPLVMQRDVQNPVVAVERSRPLASAFDLLCPPGAAQHGVALQPDVPFRCLQCLQMRPSSDFPNSFFTHSGE